MRAMRGSFLLAMLLMMYGCATNTRDVPGPTPPRPYARGTTDYQAGKATVVQPDIESTPVRNFDGFRVAGPDSDLDVEYWNALLYKMQKDGRNERGVFDVFRARYTDLKVYRTDAADAELREFRRWAKNHGIGEAFDRYWGLE